MASTESLSYIIRKKFAGVPLPSHCGLHAAMAKDDWIDDEDLLREITLREDYSGEWWNVPREHLLRCMMALSYLDASGMAFSLPAYMTAILEEPKLFDHPGLRTSSWQVVYTMLPNDEEPVLASHFLESSPILVVQCGAFARISLHVLPQVMRTMSIRGN